MSLTPRLTLIGLYNYDNSLFKNLMLPNGIENETFIDTLLMKYGECPLVSPDLSYMTLAIGAWSRKWYSNIERMLTAINAEYNPIYNYDKHEEWEESGTATGNDTRTVTGNDSGTITVSENRTIEDKGTIERTYNSDTEHKVSAYNESDYQEDNKDIIDGNDDTETHNTSEVDATTQTQNSENTSTENIGSKTEQNSGSKVGHIYGNIGTTKSQDMVEDELKLRTKYNIYNIISELFYHEFCLYIF